MKPEIRIASIGNVDSAKTTTVGVLSKYNLDNGRGSARKMIMKHPHETSSGRTSSITQHYIETDNSIIGFIDLAGHQKYLKTTVSGLNGCFIDYVMVTIGADRGVIGMTKEHLTIALALKLPIFIVITKIDIAIEHKLTKIRNRLQNIFDHPLAGKKKLQYVTKDNIIGIAEKFDSNVDFVPVFEVSNVNGSNINSLRQFVFNLNKTRQIGNSENKNPLFKIDDTFKLDGIGIILSGIMSDGTIYNNSELFIGPFNGVFYPIQVKSIHNNFKQIIPSLTAGQCGCLNIRVLQPKKYILNRDMITKGVIVMGHPHCIRKFDAKVTILHHPTTICKNYEPVIHCGTVRQTAKICKMDKELIRTGDTANITFEFKFNPEYIELNTNIIFREGNTKGIGTVIKIY
jgi:GTPase